MLIRYFLHSYVVTVCVVVVTSQEHQGCDCDQLHQLRVENKVLRELVMTGHRPQEMSDIAPATPALPSPDLLPTPPSLPQQTWSESLYTSTYNTLVTTPVSILIPIWTRNKQVFTTITELETVESIATSTLTTSVLVDVTPTKVLQTPSQASTAEPHPTKIVPIEIISTKIVPTEIISTEIVPTEIVPTKENPTKTKQKLRSRFGGFKKNTNAFNSYRF
eukprot:GFUD01032409.1.p1 GENE.GFUD01032409.1~~GFUD01032409.1.p1  ORF type:complete len:251 (+),score=73.19 GFUD01032409.1:99-755(+)